MSGQKATASSAGKGDPYWYEWTVGLLKVVEMLQPESGIESVSFQVTGEKGWDDVAVRYSNGRDEFLQVKHSRVGKNITFGDLVSADDQSSSLLNSLFGAWKTLKLKPENSRCILFTNRASGGSAGRSDQGVLRPPLFDFISWLRKGLQSAKSMRDFRPPNEWQDAWKEWIAQLAPGTPAERFKFLQSFEIQSNQEDLPSLEQSVLAALSKTFQIPNTRALPLFHALDHALRRWTTTHECVTAEDAWSAMALDGEIELEHRAPPPPSPFFPSRNTALGEIEMALKTTNGSPIIFLCAEPGAGKTSLVSQLANRRTPDALQGLVGLRYFAFRPITPESPLIPPDADHFVRSDPLWFSLLSQLRRGLRGKLRDYQVPLRNDLLTWPEARAHVLRIAERLGREMGRQFVIAIDGIDHAARAMRYDGAQAKDFFASLPSPEEIDGKPLRLLLAGQPPEAYPEYPVWLRTKNHRVQALGIGRLDVGDILVVLRDSKCPIPAEQDAAAARLIEAATHGNTLAAVFAVAEARTCKTVEELQATLTDRHLGEGLQRYYCSIWEHALNRVPNPPVGMDIALATALCLTTERLSGTLMASAFASLGLSSEQWHFLLCSLGPLVVEDSDGFRVLHNDVRIFLHGLLGNLSATARRQSASLLAEHYLKPECNRWFTHKSLRRLLRDAGRETEWARVFTVDWVFEAAALGIPCAEMSDDCSEALRQAVALRDWNVMQELACATETLERWEERCEYNPPANIRKTADASTPFLHTEAFVRPLANWLLSDLHDLAHDTETLIAAGEIARARSLLERWLAELSVKDMCRSIQGLMDIRPQHKDDEVRLNEGAGRDLESLGAASRAVGFDLKRAKAKEDIEHEAQAHFEAGWVRASCKLGPFDSLATCFSNRPVFYLHNYEVALRRFAAEGHWHLVRALMKHLQQSHDRLNHDFKAEAAWWALRSDASSDDTKWLDALPSPHFGFPENRGENLTPALAICRALGWKDAGGDAGAIANRVFDSLRFDPQRLDSVAHYRLLFRAAATVAQACSVLHRRGVDAAGDILPPVQLARFVSALWDYRFGGINSHKDRSYAGQLAIELVRVALQLGEAHQNALLETAKPVVEKFPVDYRRESLWELHQRTGRIEVLRAWLKRWLADDGWLWADEAGSRDDIAQDLLPLARELGEHELANRAEERLRWLSITYRSHKEYSFDTPATWFDRLAQIEPTCWQDLGMKLWTLSEACSESGGDNRCSWQVGESLGAAAWASGPADVWQLFAAEYPRCGSEYWLHPAANRISGGLTECVSRKPNLSWRDKITGWCLAVGLSRWFNNESIKELTQLRDALKSTAQNEEERNRIAESIERLTPGESQRDPHRDSSESVATSSDPENDDLQDWLGRIGNGEEVPPRTAAILLRRALSEQPQNFNQIATTILGAVGVGGAYGWGSYAHGNYNAVFEIARLVSDDVLWNLTAAAVKYARSDSAWWTQGVTRNLYLILMARAVKHGAPALRTGLERILKMHERWACGGRSDLELPVIKLPSADGIQTWGDMAARCLTFLLASRSAEIVESALVGIHALAAHEPNIIPRLLELANGDLWKHHWILNSAEVWAALFPTELERARPILESWLASGPLHLRIQAWIILRRLALSLNKPLPLFPNPIPDSQSSSVLAQPARRIMETPAMQRGSVRFVDIHHSASGTIERVEHVTSADLTDVKSDVATKLMQVTPEDFDAEPWPVRIRCSGDTRCSSLQGNLILDEAFDDCLRRSSLPAGLQGKFAQAFLGSENPWTLRATPLPDPDSSAWPTEDELRGRDPKSADKGAIRQKLYLLATQHRVSEDEIVLAARAQVYTWCDDYIFRFWWEEVSDESKAVSPRPCPTTMSGRTFAFDFSDWFEPQTKPGKRPLTFAVGGRQRLALCFPEFMPAMMWRTEFGWQSSPENPLLWRKDGYPVARYECIHGTPRLTQSGHPRQPILGRWLVKRIEWEILLKARGPFRWRDDFEHFSSDVER